MRQRKKKEEKGGYFEELFVKGSFHKFVFFFNASSFGRKFCHWVNFEVKLVNFTPIYSGIISYVGECQIIKKSIR